MMSYLSFAVLTGLSFKAIIERKTRRAGKALCFSFLSAFLMTVFIIQPLGFAADSYYMEVNTGFSSAEDYWTPERMKNAKPMPLPKADLNSESEDETGSVNAGRGEPQVGYDGQPPKVKVRPDRNNILFVPDSGNKSSSAKFPVNQPQNAGTFGAHFSSSRLIPLTADRVYPYMAVGKLFFTQPGQGDFVCSGSVIRPRVVLTAGHCVHRGSGGANGFFTNFMFVPAFRDGAAPFQRWSVVFVAATTTWVNGGGTFPNAADYAMFEMQDRNVGGGLRKIADITGFLGFQTQSLIPNHVHLLGYPNNLDGGQKMHQVTAGSFRTESPNAVIYGSDMTGGSSGGPWVQNFGALATGQTGGTNTGINRVVGITSYGRVDTNPKIQGSSIPDSRFTNLLNLVCGHRAGNC